MDTDKILEQIGKFEALLLVRGAGGVEVAPPVILGENIVKIRVLLVQLVDKVAEAELDYRRSKAARFDKFIKEGMKKSPAIDSLDFEQDLIDKKVAAERLRNYLKYIDSLVSSVQTVIRVQTGIAKSEL